MNLFVADPHWGCWIILYFYLGGIAAGAYFTATLIDLTNRESDRELARLGYWIAFPLVALCGSFLIVDLDRPERFWHMLVRSEVVHEALDAGWPTSGRGWALMVQAPLLKYWSPMSVGSWALLLFGACSFLSVVGSLWPKGRLAWLLRDSAAGKFLQIVGCTVGFFVASYTGALLTATNQPLWSDSAWIAPLFLTSAASTGMATLLLLGRFRRAVPAEALHRLERADRWALLLEIAVFAIFLLSLGNLLPPILSTVHGLLLILGTSFFLLLALLALRSRDSMRVWAVALSVLFAGLVLRQTLLWVPTEMLGYAAPRLEAQIPHAERVETPGPSLIAGFGAEDGRVPGEAGADPGNRPAELRPRSKLTDEP